MESESKNESLMGEHPTETDDTTVEEDQVHQRIEANEKREMEEFMEMEAVVEEEITEMELLESVEEEEVSKDKMEIVTKEPESAQVENEQDQRQQFIFNIKKTEEDTKMGQEKEADSEVLHMSHSSSGSHEGLSESNEVIQLEIKEFEEDGIAPGDEDLIPKKPVIQEEHHVEETKDEVKEEKDLEDEEADEGGPAEAPQEEDKEDESEEDEEDEEEEKPSESVIDLLYEMDEEFNPELEYVDTREGDEEWQEPIYDPEDFISEPYLSDKCTLEKNILEFNYSLGYDSRRRYNLCVVDEHTVIYLSGNYIHIYDVEKSHFQYIRSSSGVGLGHCAKHPFEPIFAVGERGNNPLIILFTYPELKIIRVLKGGTEMFYNYLYFSPNGEWLISQGGEPDNSLSVWNWKYERMVISQKCLGREVWRAETNPFIVGGITTSGVSHIKFWTMNETFTGLKLRGSSGKFGTNEFCDISTFCALPSNMVLSPNSSKNVYVWEGEEIRMELKRRNGQSLHEDDIAYLEFKQQFDEIFTVGLEGKYKVWDYTRIEYAKKSELYELELQPTFQRKIQDEMGIAHPMSFQRKTPNNPNSEMYYMQDRRGSIWSVELAVKEKLAPSKRVFLGHQSPIGDIAPSPADYYLASIGGEGKLHVYNMKRKKLIMVKYFGIGGSSLLWLPLTADSTATVLLIGFSDGTVRVVILSIRARELRPKDDDTNFVNIIQAFKPHSAAVTAISFNHHRLEERMVLTGSLDRRIFLHWLKPRMDYVKLEPFAFVEISDPVHYMTWNKDVEAVLVTSGIGTIVELMLPKELPEPPSNSYQITVPKRISHFTSVKSEILRNIVVERNIQRKQRRKEKREKKKQAEFEKEKRRLERNKQVETKKQKIKHIETGRTAGGEPAFDFKRMIDGKDSDDSEGGVGKVPNRRVRTRFDDFSDQVIESDDEFLQFLDAIEPKPDDETAATPTPSQSSHAVEEHKVKAAEAKRDTTDEVPLGEEEELEVASGEEEEQEIVDDDDSENEEFEDAGGDISEDEDLPPLYEPPEPSPLYFANYVDKDSVWVSVGGYDVGYIYEYKLGQNKPYKSTLLEYDTYIEMNCSTQLFDYEFLILGLGNGAIKFIRSNSEDFTDFSDYWQFSMHDNMNGKIKKIVATYDMRYLYSVGDDSNLFFYKVNLPESKFPDKKNLPQLLPPPLKLRIDGYIGPETLSLEDAKLASLLEKRKQMGVSRKIILKRKIDELVQRFRILNELNQGLPETQRLPTKFFIINEEFDRKNCKTIANKKTKLTRNLEIEYWKAKIMRDKIYNYFIKPIKTFKIYIFGIDIFSKVTTFYQQKLSLPFLEAEKEAEAMMVEILKKGREKFKQPLKVLKEQKLNKKFKKSKLEVRPLIKGEEEIVELLERQQKALFTRLSKRRQRRKLLQNILTLFLEEKESRKKQFIEDLEARKIDASNMTYTLKSDPNFKLNNLRRISKEKKFFQLVATRRKIHDLISHFNSEVLRLRDMKSKAIALYKSLIFDAAALYSEFKDVPTLSPPKKVIIFEPLEFPEVIFMDNPPEFPHDEGIIKQPYRDHLFCQLYEINKKFPIENDKYVEEEIKKKIQTEEKLDVLKADLRMTNKKYGFHTLWEQELMEERKQFLISEYIKKVQIMKDMLAEYDKDLGKLVAMKIDYEIKTYYLKIFFFKYYEELQIIRSHQLVEKEITNKMEVFIIQKHVYILRINIRKKRINKCLEDIKTCNKNFDKITTNFYNIITNVTVAHKRHLIRIFKKKWKPEKTEGDESEESSEEEEEDEDEDEEEEEDVDLEDLMATDFVPMDENVRPEGLAKDVFDKTFIYRDERHAEERKIYEKKLEIQHYKDQIDHLKKTLLTIETFVALFQVKMSIVLEEKHKALSSVRTVVVLDASQMQHFDTEANIFPSVKESVLFPLYTLKNLQARKRQLMEDIVSIQLKKQETVKHVKRLDLDIRYLRKRLKNLKEQISKEKIEKFGIPINLGRLEETILLKIIKEFKYDSLPFHLKFHADIVKLQKELFNVEKSTGEHIQQNTYEQLKLGALMEQKRVYQEVLRKVQSRKEVQYMSLSDINKSNEELKTMLKIQGALKKFLLEEIRDVKYRKEASDIQKQEIHFFQQMAEKIAEDALDHFVVDKDEEYDSFEENEKNDLRIVSKVSRKKIKKTQRDEKEVTIREEVIGTPIDLTTDEEDYAEGESRPEEGQDKLGFSALDEVLEDYKSEND